MNNILLLFLFCELLLGARTSPETSQNARVTRIFPKGLWSLSLKVNDGMIQTIKLRSLPAEISALKLLEGDIVIVEERASKKIMKEKSVWRSFYELLASNKVALYFPTRSSYDLKSIPVYHWKTPYLDPRSFNDSVSFFKDGRPFGSGVKGFTSMVDDIEREKPRHFFFLGSLYDQTSGYGFLEAPFRDEIYPLEEKWSRNGAMIWLDPFP
jgi:hypothetical protein